MYIQYCWCVGKYNYLISGEAESEINTFLSEDHPLQDYKEVSL